MRLIDTALSLEEVTCTFAATGDASGQYTALRDVTLRVGSGEFVSVVGPTGCGKSTLLNVGAELPKPSAGIVLGFGEPLAGLNVGAGVFFNVYQGVKEVSPVVLANARMLGANQKQLLRYVYLPSATSWVFSSLHASVGLAFVGAVVGEYLGSSRGVGYLILQAEGTFDVNTVVAGILVLTAFALALDRIVGKVGVRFMKWQPQGGETVKL